MTSPLSRIHDALASLQAASFPVPLTNASSVEITPLYVARHMQINPWLVCRSAVDTRGPTSALSPAALARRGRLVLPLLPAVPPNPQRLPHALRPPVLPPPQDRAGHERTEAQVSNR